MSIQAGLVGLPNVGKSTLFNALTKSSIPAENYPFCTIDPHVAITEVQDPRIDKLQAIYKSERKIPTTVTFVDIAGLVQGAASGEGLGNQFLSHIAAVDLILHVLRCFEDPDIISTRGMLDPIGDYEIIMAELMLKDLEVVSKRLERMDKLIRAAQGKPLEIKELTGEKELLTTLSAALNKGDIPAVRNIGKGLPKTFVPVLSAKNFLIIANVKENELADDGYKNNPHFQKLVEIFGIDRVIPVCAKVESELAQLTQEEADEMMGLLGIKERSLSRIIRESYKHLGLITFFTCGPKETHAWPIRSGITIRVASGEIHSDLERGFICAEVFNSKDIFELGSENKVKEQGRMRIEGQHYIVQDGDIVHVRFNV